MGDYKSRRRSSQVSTGHLEAPPNTSTLLSTQGMMLPGMFVEQLAILMISCARRTRSQMLNWLSSPTNACVASNLPPTVSWGRGTEHVGQAQGGHVCPLSWACDRPGGGAPAWEDVGQGQTPPTQMAPCDHRVLLLLKLQGS